MNGSVPSWSRPSQLRPPRRGAQSMGASTAAEHAAAAALQRKKRRWGKNEERPHAEQVSIVTALLQHCCSNVRNGWKGPSFFSTAGRCFLHALASSPLCACACVCTHVYTRVFVVWERQNTVICVVRVPIELRHPLSFLSLLSLSLSFLSLSLFSLALRCPRLFAPGCAVFWYPGCPTAWDARTPSSSRCARRRSRACRPASTPR